MLVTQRTRTGDERIRIPAERHPVATASNLLRLFPKVAGAADTLALAKQILAATGVGIAPGVAFGPEGEGWFRLCFAASTERLEPARPVD